ncbi:MAG: carbonic anhydrase family protein [Azoarcus sp.]|jgi:carbonic anhydrase|nr:carbonic anhydrase family protein [Azoarcus sp.]
MKKSVAFKFALLAFSIMPTAVCAAHWGYEGEGSPERWGELDNAWKTCKLGMNQSPINIDATLNARISPLPINYIDAPETLVNNGHTIQANMKADAKTTITIDNKPYTLHQFHFHAPSENTIRGKYYAMEMHLVHKNAEGEIAVVAVMFEKGAENTELDKLWKVMPEQADKKSLIEDSFDINKLLPKEKNYWRFSGSLTTPPCSEGIIWLVLKRPLTLSEKQLEKFAHAMHHPNNRPVQPLHGRTVVE